MGDSLITFKGNQEGIYIHIKEGTFESIKRQLDVKLQEAREFLKGGKVVNFKGKDLSLEEKETLKNIITDKYGIDVDQDRIYQEEEDTVANIEPTPDVFEGIEEGHTKFVRMTMRSGQRIEFDGNIVVLGDVNPGAEVVAKGNIIVMGNLRGVVHAGSDGNREALVAAFNLNSKQLRIADLIARAPDHDVMGSKWPEIAKIKEDRLIIEPYLQKNSR